MKKNHWKKVTKDFSNYHLKNSSQRTVSDEIRLLLLLWSWIKNILVSFVLCPFSGMPAQWPLFEMFWICYWLCRLRFKIIAQQVYIEALRGPKLLPAKHVRLPVKGPNSLCEYVWSLEGYVLYPCISHRRLHIYAKLFCDSFTHF